ncbi:hypothetical protein PCANB_001076 [Pneumocystis canis]|nr:hypothetical protein PCK1_001081 [Pneumocystis canis]KAG5437283.1 hypothetical protein PCANB_001076 [Pneumocystis canis]
MPIPFESILPFGILITLFATTGGLLAWVQQNQNNGHSSRYSIDRWDKQMIERDYQITGSLYKQKDHPNQF